MKSAVKGGVILEESLKDRLWRDFCDREFVGCKILVVAVLLPNGSIETITNTSGIPDKVKYYMDKYDEQFRLIANPFVQIVGYMLV